MSRQHEHAAEALLTGRNGLRVLSAMSPQQPDGLLAALVRGARRKGVHLTILLADLAGAFAFLDQASIDDARAGRLELVSVAGAIPRAWSGIADFLPVSLYDLDRLLREGALGVDVVVARMSRCGTAGELGYGAMVGYTEAALAGGVRAVIEVVDGHGGGAGLVVPSIVVKRADMLIEVGAEAPVQRSMPTPSAEHYAIGDHVAGLLTDGATLQLGLGAVAEGVIARCGDKRSLGLHSGVLTPSTARLIASGVATGAMKSVDSGIAVATGIYGVGEPPKWNGTVELRPVSETHAPAVLAAHQRLWAINSAFEVDLGGNVNAEYAGGSRLASGGGQTDFARAAHLSVGGASVIALPALTGGGASRIVARLPAAHPATCQGQDIDFVVTEHGVAALRGRTARERAEALVAVAAPQHRVALRSDFQRAGQAAY